MDTIDCVIIGAGVVGLACARAISMAGHSVIVLEAARAIGTETSSRNSEVIHSGIYYPQGSLKAKACVQGREQLYAYCNTHHVPHANLGKLIVATTPEEQSELAVLLRKGQLNGVDDLKLISRREALIKEPNLSFTGALWSPSTGIIDSHSLMLSFQGELEDHGGIIVFNTPLERSEVAGDAITLYTGGNQPFAIKTRLLINSAGLQAQDIARKIYGYPINMIPQRHLARGVYFSLLGKSPFTHLVYPAPEPGGLGVHATLDLAGQCRFGPDVEWIDEIDYHVDSSRADIFYDRIRKYWPDLKDGCLAPAYAGIRPKIVERGEPAGDFIIQAPMDHRSGPIVNLFGIESPGLTSSMAIADVVEGIAKEVLT